MSLENKVSILDAMCEEEIFNPRKVFEYNNIKESVKEFDLLLNHATNLSIREFNEKYQKDMKENEVSGDFIYRKYKEIFGEFKNE